MPETYQYIQDYLKPHAGSKWVTVRNPKGSLYDHCMDRKILPIKQRRWCTEDFKIKPIQRFLRNNLGATAKNPVTQHIGFSVDEAHRANFHVRHPKYVVLQYPLLNDKITRRQCEDIIMSNGWPIPVKSGCYYCPFSRKRNIRKMAAEHPELIQKIRMLEKNNYTYPKKNLFGDRTVDSIVAADSMSLDDFEEFGCDSGHCML